MWLCAQMGRKAEGGTWGAIKPGRRGIVGRGAAHEGTLNYAGLAPLRAEHEKACRKGKVRVDALQRASCWVGCCGRSEGMLVRGESGAVEDGDVRAVWGRLQRLRSQCEGPTVRDAMPTLFWRSKPSIC